MPHLSSVHNQLVSEGVRFAVLAASPSCLSQNSLFELCISFAVPLHGVILYFLQNQHLNFSMKCCGRD